MDRSGFEIRSTTSTHLCAELSGASIMPRHRAVSMYKVLKISNKKNNAAELHCLSNVGPHHSRLVEALGLRFGGHVVGIWRPASGEFGGKRTARDGENRESLRNSASCW